MKMIDRYRCGPKTLTELKLTRWMTDRHKCGPKTLIELIRWWLINIVWSKKLKLNSNWHEEWTIDIRWSWLKLKTPTDKMNYWSIYVQSQNSDWTNKMMTNQYRCEPKNWNWHGTEMKMTDQYRWGPKTLTELTRWWLIDIGTTPITQTHTDKMNEWSSGSKSEDN